MFRKGDRLLDQEQKIQTGESLFRYRDFTPIPLILLLLIFGKPTVLSATIGVLIIVFGELFRIYSVSFIGAVSRTRSESTGRQLVTGGPFAYVRNPLYIGNFFISIGFAVFSGSSWLILLTAILFAAQYHFIVVYEEANLSQKFGEEYDKYQRQTPSWFPAVWPRLDEIEWPREYSTALKSERRTLSAISILLLLLLAFA